MFCTTCGKKLEEGTKFCIYCGAKQEDAPAPAAESAATAPVYESTASVEKSPAPEAPAFETPTPKAPSFDVPPVAPVFDGAPAKKEGKGKKIALIAVIGVLILALIGLNAYQYFVMTPKTADKLADAKSDLKKAEAKYDELKDEYDELEGLYDSADSSSVDLGDICYYARYNNIGYASDAFHTDKAVIVLSEDDYDETLTLTLAVDTAVTVSYNLEGSSADVSFDEDTWEGDTTTLTISPLEKGVTLLTFSNDLNSETVSVIIIVTD